MSAASHHTPNHTPLAYALAYARRGWRVVPIPPRLKRPVLVAWQTEGTTDPDRIRHWWAESPDYGIGIVTGASSGLVVIDVDEHGEIRGGDTLADLEATHGRLPDTVEVMTGGGGRHLYFQYPAWDTITNDAGRRLGPGMDIRGEGGQVVAPPSLHASGEHYLFEASSDPGSATVAAMPSWLIELLTSDPKGDRPPRERAENAGTRPGDKWAAVTQWADLLEATGAVFLGMRTDHVEGSQYQTWARPAMPGEAAYEPHLSATVDYRGGGVLKCFSSNWMGLDPQTGEVWHLAEGDTYTKVGFYAAVHCGGDFRVARVQFEEMGFTGDPYEFNEITGAGRAEPGQAGPDSSLILISSSPTPMGPAAYIGVIGDFVQAASAYTEAGREALLSTGLTLFGASIGRAPHIRAGNARHTPALFTCSVGKTSRGRKGTATTVGRALIEQADPLFAMSRILGGFGSGESVVDMVGAVHTTGSDDVETPSDCRLLIVESEFARMLKIAARDGSTLSQVIRDGWDGVRLQARSRSRTAVADNYHLSVVANVTLDELRARLTDAETYGGLANRFLWVHTQRAQLLSRHGNVPDTLITEHARNVTRAITTARKRGLVDLTPEAWVRWEEMYAEVDRDDPAGLLGAATSRAEAQLLRLALTYALACEAIFIDVPHLEAAWEFWSYCRSSAAVIFGTASGDPIADRLLAAIRQAGEDGLTGTQQSTVFGRNVVASKLAAARAQLEQSGQIRTVHESSGGRPTLVSYAVTQQTNQTNEPSNPRPPVVTQQHEQTKEAPR